MHKMISIPFLATAVVLSTHVALAAGDAEHGAEVFRACVACHSLQPNHNMTGPSLAGVWGRKAGTLTSFDRYSPALKASNVVWDASTLDRWLKNPAQFIPHNWMTFPGISDAKSRADLIAYLKVASSAGGDAQTAQQGHMGGMMGGMGGQRRDLKKVGASEQVQSITYCRDTYRVTTGDGETRAFWDANLRFETDSSDLGPSSGSPAILPAGMMGDRASVIFAKPEEISAFIKHQC